MKYTDLCEHVQGQMIGLLYAAVWIHRVTGDADMAINMLEQETAGVTTLEELFNAGRYHSHGLISGIDALEESMISPIEHAILSAFEAHKDDKYGDKSYMFHLNDVYWRLVAVDANDNTLMAAWLHDVIEDHPEISTDLWFPNGAVLQIVWYVTDRDFPNRRERKIDVFSRASSHYDARRLKLSDICSNVANSLSTGVSPNRKKLRMYYDEQDLVFGILLGNVQPSHSYYPLFLDYCDLIKQAKKELNL